VRMPSGERKKMRAYLKGKKASKRNMEVAYRIGFLQGLKGLFAAITKTRPRRAQDKDVTNEKK